MISRFLLEDLCMAVKPTLAITWPQGFLGEE
jgi:hypothetical protein